MTQYGLLLHLQLNGRGRLLKPKLKPCTSTKGEPSPNLNTFASYTKNVNFALASPNTYFVNILPLNLLTLHHDYSLISLSCRNNVLQQRLKKVFEHATQRAMHKIQNIWVKTRTKTFVQDDKTKLHLGLFGHLMLVFHIFHYCFG